MIFLRALYGPFARSEAKISGKVYTIDWSFFGVREDNSMGHWTLRYDVKGRKFFCFTSGCSEKARKGEVPVHPDAFVPDRPMVYAKTYVELLRQRLSNADFASASAASLVWPR
ncbi:MAG: hypothetical protein EOS72_03345 [Mesorhizobium sp.]|uniref:hypothetical protein n=1 Tax=Mesorhizobium sp. TaxID=1871066 RepID=UPI000FE9DD47|nr:hypothetical protein [Mesorhizobium sp.]RWC91704.1 MAG: hypothetical protein EOS72_03345 [Mesorhizobium sp.]